MHSDIGVRLVRLLRAVQHDEINTSSIFSSLETLLLIRTELHRVEVADDLPGLSELLTAGLVTVRSQAPADSWCTF